MWDGEVNPQGIGANYAIPFGGGALKFSGLYFLVDHSIAGSDSSMFGAQLGLDMSLTEDFRFELSAAQYDYSLPGAAGADAGDFRSNLIGPDGRYVSDFDLIDVIAAMTFRGWERWPVRLTGEYVNNRALHVALPPQNNAGRSKYGMGLKTAAYWLGNKWSVATKKLGETVEHQATVDVEKIAAGDATLEYQPIENKSPDLHYTIITIEALNRQFHGRTLGKIRQFLSSMYREDFRQKHLKLEWQGTPVEWEDLDARLLRAPDKSLYKKNFEFTVEGKKIHGWPGIFDRGGRADAGFSIIHCGRVVRGWPDSWRPGSLYGQLQGSNDLVNQRLVGEIHLDAFEVSHTKDDILWLGDQEDEVEKQLLKHCGDYKTRAQERRKNEDDERGPSDTETAVAVDELRKELTSPEMVDAIELEAVPPPDVVDNQIRVITEEITKFDATFSCKIRDLITVNGYLRPDLSPNDPYVTHDATQAHEVLIIVNQAHPHWKQLKGSDGVLNYLRHCVYDGIAEWQAMHKAASLTPNTVKLLKDKLLRVPFDIDMNAGVVDQV